LLSKLIGTPAKRLDTPAKVNGTAVFGIDVRPPGVKIATLAQSRKNLRVTRANVSYSQDSRTAWRFAISQFSCLE